jgi:hypothetical protein
LRANVYWKYFNDSNELGILNIKSKSLQIISREDQSIENESANWRGCSMEKIKTIADRHDIQPSFTASSSHIISK